MAVGSDGKEICDKCCHNLGYNAQDMFFTSEMRYNKRSMKLNLKSGIAASLTLLSRSSSVTSLRVSFMMTSLLLSKVLCSFTIISSRIRFILYSQYSSTYLLRWSRDCKKSCKSTCFSNWEFCIPWWWRHHLRQLEELSRFAADWRCKLLSRNHQLFLCLCLCLSHFFWAASVSPLHRKTSEILIARCHV